MRDYLQLVDDSCPAVHRKCFPLFQCSPSKERRWQWHHLQFRVKERSPINTAPSKNLIMTISMQIVCCVLPCQVSYRKPWLHCSSSYTPSNFHIQIIVCQHVFSHSRHHQTGPSWDRGLLRSHRQVDRSGRADPVPEPVHLGTGAAFGRGGIGAVSRAGEASARGARAGGEGSEWESSGKNEIHRKKKKTSSTKSIYSMVCRSNNASRPSRTCPAPTRSSCPRSASWWTTYRST